MSRFIASRARRTAKALRRMKAPDPERLLSYSERQWADIRLKLAKDAAGTEAARLIYARLLKDNKLTEDDLTAALDLMGEYADTSRGAADLADMEATFAPILEQLRHVERPHRISYRPS